MFLSPTESMADNHEAGGGDRWTPEAQAAARQLQLPVEPVTLELFLSNSYERSVVLTIDAKDQAQVQAWLAELQASKQLDAECRIATGLLAGHFLHISVARRFTYDIRHLRRCPGCCSVL